MMPSGISWGLVAAAAAGVAVLGLAARRRWLTPSGVVAAAVVGGVVAIGLGAPGLGLLGFFFVSSSAMTRALRRDRADGDGGGRTAGQVLANAGIAGLAALAARDGAGAWTFAFGGAMAAATADTWSSEVGEWRAGATRLVTTWRRVDPGVNGGVSWPGSLAAGAGAFAVGGLASLCFGSAALVVPLAVGGISGALADSVVGATIEGRARGLENDAVNWIGTLTGAAVAVILGGT